MSSGLWYRTLVYLGLKEEPEEGYDDLPERVDVEADHADGEVVHQRFDPVGDPDLDETRRPAARREPAADPDDGRENVRPLRVADTNNVRSLGGTVRLAVVELARFEDVEEVGSRYRTGQPVLFDLRGAEPPVARRVVDFVAGLTYASRGRMSKVGTRAFLLVPDGVELPDDEVRRLTSLGYRPPAEHGS